MLLNLFTFSYMSNAKNDVRCVVDSDKRITSTLHMGTHVNNLKLNVGLFVGSAMFGAGWGIIGVCPGPAIVS